METLAKAIREASEPDKILIELFKPDNANKFIESLNSLSEIMTFDRNKSQPPPEAIQVSPKPKPILAPLIYNLFSALSVYWLRSCICKNSHQAALALFTNRAYSSDDDTPASFTVLLSNPKTANSTTRWLETGITVRKPMLVLPIHDISQLSL